MQVGGRKKQGRRRRRKRGAKGKVRKERLRGEEDG